MSSQDQFKQVVTAGKSGRGRGEKEKRGKVHATSTFPKQYSISKQCERCNYLDSPLLVYIATVRNKGTKNYVHTPITASLSSQILKDGY